MHEFLTTLINSILPVLLLGPLSVVILIAYVRMLGLRSFSKITSFDFATTVATGSLLANAAVASNWAAYSKAVLAIGGLFVVQYLLAKGRVLSPGFRSLISNEPVLLFSKGVFNKVAMKKSRVAEEDIWAKIREANALKKTEIHAVILETTGDISVLHGDLLDSELIEDVVQTS